jgi:hypothetical protein
MSYRSTCCWRVAATRLSPLLQLPSQSVVTLPTHPSHNLLS